MSKNIKNISSSHWRSKQTGFTLLEIMVSALILSVGVLGVASLQIVGLKGSQQSYTKQQAMSVVQNLTERMRSNRQSVLDGDYQLADVGAIACGTAPPNCSDAAAVCTGTELAQADLYNVVCGYQVGNGARTGAIKNEDATDNSTFVDGELVISCPNANGCETGDVTIDLSWTERAIDSEEAVEDSLIINTNISL